MSFSSPSLQSSQLVSVRQRRYVVSDVTASLVDAGPLSASAPVVQHLVALHSVEDDALGEELQIVWELEPAAQVLEHVALPSPGGFDAPERLDAFLDAVRWGAVSTADVRSVQSPFRSGIEIEDYQLDPVVRAIQMPRVNLLVADDVGLGKTIEAGLVALELIIRHRARRVLVVCPASLQMQWQEQMRDKFGLEFRIVDSELMRALRRKRGIHVNPWAHFPRLITSIDFLKRERPLRLFSETLPSQGEPLYPRRYDVLILDEAHNCAPSGRGRYATDSQRTEAIRLLVPHFEHKLFLTATPHNGYPESFTALLELLDNQRFARGTQPDRSQLGAVMVRRLKSELESNWDGTPRFPKRAIEPLEVAYTEEERRVHSALREYSRLRQQAAAEGAERFATEFVLKMLKKRLFSSPAAFAITLEQHEKSLRSARRAGQADGTRGRNLQRQLDRADEDYYDDDEAEQANADAVDAATRLFRPPDETERELLKGMKEWADRASGQLDAKATGLIDWLHKTIRPGGKWCDERVIIFTEYRATQNWLHGIMAREGLAGGDRLLTLHGGMQTDEREKVKAAFQARPTESSVRILLATDAASEGIDLQNHCHRLIHYEIPWNPNRMEQRNGRIDRHGQKADEVLIYHFVGSGYRDREARMVEMPVGDLEGDLEFLMRASRKVQAIREDLGKVGPVIAQQVEEAMLGRRTRLDTSQAERDSEPVRRLLKFERDLARQVKQLVDQFRETQRDLHLSPQNICKVVQVALELAGQPPLQPTTLDGVWPHPGRGECPVFRLPGLTGSWASCSEGLEHPHTREVRPIVFDHALTKDANGKPRDDVVLAHLNHRLVQMCLRLLRAEVWSQEGSKRLHRIAARVVPDNVLATPAIVAHARLVVIGGDCHRLHEEIITAGGHIREGRFSRMNLGPMQEALEAATDEEPSEDVKRRLLQLWPNLEGPLRQALENRMRDRTDGLRKQLEERRDKESADITAILTELRVRIEAELIDPKYLQMQFEGWAPPEREQFERNTEWLRARVRA
ncbi:MAG: DISARM system SNF2-like helicase DrmD, partial [Armatimonadetes bacterium]|nr:DISARM system SNF2-like helicase DrmD [Armatimonadota bacterium]